MEDNFWERICYLHELETMDYDIFSNHSGFNDLNRGGCSF